MKFGKYLLIKLGIASAVSAAVVVGVVVYASQSGETYPRTPNGYATLPKPEPVATHAPVQVTEFFMYGCPHCAVLSPALEAWIAMEGDRVLVRRVPAGRGEVAARHAALFYALAKLGVADRLQAAVYAEIHQHGDALDTDDKIIHWVTEQGVDPVGFTQAYHSADVATEVMMGDEEMARDRISTVPTVVVDGRWVISPTTAGGIREALDVMTDRVKAAAPVSTAPPAHSTVPKPSA